MRDKGNTYIHVIEEGTGVKLLRRLVTCVPRPGDEFRIGGPGGEKYYKVTRVIWVYDEPDNPFQRVNIGAELCA
jgi:hypothetical protein